MGFDGRGFGDAMLFFGVMAVFGIVFAIVSVTAVICFAFTGDSKQLFWGIGFAAVLGTLAGYWLYRQG